MNDKHAYFIDYLRVLACALIVCVHVVSYNPALFYKLPLSNYINFLIRCGVPIFFIISGYALMTRYSDETIKYVPFITKRFTRVIVPYFFISALTIISRLFLEKYKLIPLSEIVYTPFDIKKIAGDIFFAGAAEHYYFLISIFLIYCFFPMLKYLFKNKYTCLLVFLCYQLIYPYLIRFYDNLQFSLPSPDVFSHALWGLKFFIVGVILYHYLRYIRNILHVYGLYFFILIITIAIFMNTQKLPYSSYMLILSYFCLALYLEKLESSFLILLGKLTFGIYIFHQPYFVKMSTIIAKKLEFTDWLLILMSFALTIITTTLFILVLRRFKFFKITFLGET